MFEPVRHAASLASWAIHRRSRERSDHEALAEHAWSFPDVPDGLEIRWLGTAGYSLSFEDHVVLIDPYVTRLPLGDLLRRKVVPPDAARVSRELPRADAVLIGHTHFDHVLDAPAVVQQHGCQVFGSRSVGALLRLYGLESHAVEVEPYRTYEIGPFEVSFVPSVHSKLALGLFVPNSGPITCDHVDRLAPQAYNCDQVWGIHIAVAGVTLYHQGSADLVDDAVRHRNVEYFLCGVAGRQFSPRYVERVLRRLEPRVVIPSHYDDFFAPMDAPMGFTIGVDVAGFTEEVAAVSKDFEIRTIAIGDTVGSTPNLG